MDRQGVILFADDHIFSDSTQEGRLFMKLNKEYPVLGVNSVEMAEKAVKSIGTFSAIILDWEFKEHIVENGRKIPLPVKTPEPFLDKHDFYSLIYVFTRTSIDQEIKKKFQRKFPGRIQFKTKSAGAPDEDFKNIKRDLKDWKRKNKKTTVALNWSSAINVAVQGIFSELTRADVNWIHELYKTADSDVSPEIEVVNLMQSLLSEKLITNKPLLESIAKLKNEKAQSKSDKGKAVAKLAQRIYYTKLDQFTFEEVPIMTGDIFVFDSRKTKYGIVVTPECDIRHKKGKANEFFELLTFQRYTAKELLRTAIKPNIRDINKPDFYNSLNEIADIQLTTNQKMKIGKILKEHQAGQKSYLFKDALNQNHKRLHLLPSFHFTKTKVDELAVVDFRKSVKQVSGKELENRVRVCKINSPFIQELRQRYLSYIGRVGVPAPIDSVKTQNIAPIL